jgi:hypothetical protein
MHKKGVKIVTALFDIGREKSGDGRSVEQYLDWFSKTLDINCYMEIYTEEKFKKFIEEKRNPELTKIIIQNIEDVPAYKYRERISDIINSESYLSRIKDKSRIECRLDLYNVIQYSKFGWLKNSISSGKEDDFYFWMDAGCSRFFDGFDTKNDWPILKNIPDDKFVVQGNYNTSVIYPDMDINSYKWENNCILVGTLFGGNGNIVSGVSDMVMEIMEKDMLDECTINNEQIALGILYKRMPSIFSVYIDLSGGHLPIFKELARK